MSSGWSNPEVGISKVQELMRVAGVWDWWGCPSGINRGGLHAKHDNFRPDSGICCGRKG